MNKIVITVNGFAGSGKSAVAQAIAQFLTHLELNVSTDLAVDLRNAEELQKVIDCIKNQGTTFTVRESV